MSNSLKLSSLGHTWLFDIDGTLVKHNGYKLDGYDTLLPGVKEFFENVISKNDCVVLLTSRTEEFRSTTIKFLDDNNIRYDHIIFNLPYGERIIINDKKPSGLEMSKSINLTRDNFCVDCVIDEEL